MGLSPASILYDGDSNQPIGVIIDGTTYRLRVEASIADDQGLATEQSILILKEILYEIKCLNLHLSIITENEINYSEVE
jgi:hypothetical protein